MAIKLRRNNMRHYFISQEHKESDFFEINHNFNGKNYSFKSCSDVFSKNQVDYGSLVLIKSIIEHKDNFGGKILDMCCGYGPIGIILSQYITGEFCFADVNETATKLTKVNCEKNGVNAEKIYLSDMFKDVAENFNHIFSNPPIKTGKAKLFEFVDGCFSHLESNGSLTLVIKKNLGEESLKKYIISKFGNCDIWQRDKGYYILHTTKTM